MLKEISKITIGLASVLSVSSIVAANFYRSDITSAAPCTVTTSPYECNTTFQVNVKETLSVDITTPSTWASGTPTYDSSTGTWSTDFLRNTVTVAVSSNNSVGFTASMYSSGSTSLTNTTASSSTLPTLASSTTRADFPANYWGYSLNASSIGGRTYNETDAGNNNSNYYPLVSTSTTPITIMTKEGTGGTVSDTRNVYFGTKANLGQASGTYAGTVVISVVTGTINESNPITPTDPATPATDTNTTDNNATYTGADTTTGGGTNGTTVYTRSSGNTTTTQISDGDNTSLYPATNANPLGVTETTSASVAENVSGGSPLAVGLAASAAVAAAAGGIFFVLAKRKEDDDDDEE